MQNNLNTDAMNYEFFNNKLKVDKDVIIDFKRF